MDTSQHQLLCYLWWAQAEFQTITSGGSLRLAWERAHQGGVYNEAADKACELAALRNPKVSSIIVGLSEVFEMARKRPAGWEAADSGITKMLRQTAEDLRWDEMARPRAAH